MRHGPMLKEAAALAASNPDLSQLIQFSRAHDPTAALRERWGSRFQERLDYLMTKSRDLVQLGQEFPVSHSELLLCMANLVTIAPYLGTPEVQVERYLRALLKELVSDVRPAQDTR